VEPKVSKKGGYAGNTCIEGEKTHREKKAQKRFDQDSPEKEVVREKRGAPEKHDKKCRKLRRVSKEARK